MKKSVALVLSSGGSRGVAHIGVIDELIEQGYNITSISGTSMGALVGGMYASGELKIFEKWMCSLSKYDVFKLVDFTLSLNGIVKGTKVLKEMKNIVPDRQIEDLKIPFICIATDIVNGKEVVFENGSLYDAIRASISIPTVFMPFEKNGLKLVDGGVLNPLPIDKIKRNDNDILIVVNVNSDKEYIKLAKENVLAELNASQTNYLSKIQHRINDIIPINKRDKLGYYNLLNNTTSLMIQKISQLTIEKYKPDIIIEIPKKSFGTYEFYKSEEIIKLGIKATKKALIKYHKNLESTKTQQSI
ncbi:MAG: patatin [Bacteroidetes bacterium]|nr:MAG: patatin [Bacteroidota bacterium]